MRSARFWPFGVSRVVLWATLAFLFTAGSASRAQTAPAAAPAPAPASAAVPVPRAAPAAPGTHTTTTTTTVEEDVFGDDAFDPNAGTGCADGACCPPPTIKKIGMGIGALLNFLVMFFLMVRLVERVFIRSGKSPLLGRHLGMSCALFLGGAGMVAIFYLITGCWAPAYNLWAGFALAVWVLHLAYTLIAVRKS